MSISEPLLETIPVAVPVPWRWQGYASAFNRRLQCCGPLFQGRFKGILVEDRLPDRDVPAARQLRAEVRIEDVVEAVCDAFGMPAEHVYTIEAVGEIVRAWRGVSVPVADSAIGL